MKRIILASVSLLALGSSAHAQISVDSITADLNAAKQNLQDAKTWVLQNQQYLTEAQTLLQVANTFSAFVQNPSLGAAMGLMNAAGLGNSLPANPASLMSLTSGNTMSLAGLPSKLSALSGLANTAYSQNHVFTCTDSSWACQQQQQRGYGVAGSMGIAQAAYQDIVNHQAVLQALRAQAATATTPAQRENIEVGIQAEVDWQQNEMSLVNSAKMLADMNQASLAQQDNESLSHALEGVSSSSGGSGPAPTADNSDNSSDTTTPTASNGMDTILDDGSNADSQGSGMGIVSDTTPTTQTTVPSLAPATTTPATTPAPTASNGMDTILDDGSNADSQGGGMGIVSDTTPTTPTVPNLAPATPQVTGGTSAPPATAPTASNGLNTILDDGTNTSSNGLNSILSTQ